MNAIKQIPADGTPLTCDAGTYKVNLVATIDGGYTLYVMAGATVIDELTDQFTDEAMARNTARTIVVKLRNGVSIWTLIADRQAAEKELIASVKATMDEATAAYLAPRVEARQIADEVAGDGQGWTRFRQAATRTAAATTDPMDQIITAAAHTDGRIVRGGGLGQATSTQLVAMQRRGLVTLTRVRRGNRHAITGGQLTAKGFKAAVVEMRSAA